MKKPPIEVQNIKLSELSELMESIKGVECNLQYRLSIIKYEKNVKETIKIYAQTDKDYETVKKACIENKLEFNTHPLYGDKKIKICMYGLVEVDTETVKSELKKYFGVEPCEIKMIKPADGYKGESRVYIIYFKKSCNVKLADLKETVSGLFNLRVRFQYYSPKKFGPTQCSNCQDYGHGSENCHRPPKCVRCGGLHASKTCNYLQPATSITDKPKIPQNMVKCANCLGAHTANYTKCIYRTNVIQKQQKYRTPHKAAKTFHFDAADFPALETRPHVPPGFNNGWRHNTLPVQTTHPTTDMMHKFLETQSNMMNMMNQMMNQMNNMLSTVTQLIEKISNLSYASK